MLFKLMQFAVVVWSHSLAYRWHSTGVTDSWVSWFWAPPRQKGDPGENTGSFLAGSANSQRGWHHASAGAGWGKVTTALMRLHQKLSWGSDLVATLALETRGGAAMSGHDCTSGLWHASKVTPLVAPALALWLNIAASYSLHFILWVRSPVVPSNLFEVQIIIHFHINKMLTCC